MDDDSNLVVVCASCHSLIHYFGTKARDQQPLPKYLGKHLRIDEVKRLQGLVTRLQRARRKAYRKRRVGYAFTVEQAISKVTETGGFDDIERAAYRACVYAVLKNLPKQARERCSYRLIRRGKCMSINLMNYLIYRSPAYGDLGAPPRYDCYLIFPNRLQSLGPILGVEDRVVFQFAQLDCITVGVTYEELLALTSRQWTLFRQACAMARGAPRTREWPSNIRIQKQ